MTGNSASGLVPNVKQLEGRFCEEVPSLLKSTQLFEHVHRSSRSSRRWKQTRTSVKSRSCSGVWMDWTCRVRGTDAHQRGELRTVPAPRWAPPAGLGVCRCVCRCVSVCVLPVRGAAAAPRCHARAASLLVSPRKLLRLLQRRLRSLLSKLANYAKE